MDSNHDTNSDLPLIDSILSFVKEVHRDSFWQHLFTCNQGGGGIQERHMAYIFVFKDGLDPPSPPSPAI